MFQGGISFRSQDIGQKDYFGSPLGSIWTFSDMNEIRTPNHFDGIRMAVFMGVGHGFRASLLVSKIVAKMDILAARWAQIGNFRT